ncbi:MAG: ChbG/HpnK family deacetylase [Flavobacteriales bacterium]|nr:ChbG/HpnK family deacetylase [Flavobacteriales bacterium]
MTERLLIANSDDFGITESVTDAIVATHTMGIMTSTTIMMNMPACDYAISMATNYPELGVGIHLNLTEGRPVSSADSVPLLLDDHGSFLNNARQRRNLLFGREKTEQAKIEIKAQMTKLLDLGLTPTHFDSHHHITGVPCAFLASAEVAKEMGINKARITSVSHRLTGGTGLHERTKYAIGSVAGAPKSAIHQWNKYRLRTLGFQTPDDKILPGRVIPFVQDPVEQFIRALSCLRPGVTEISFHPGYMDSVPNDSAKTAELRVRDYRVSTDTKVLRFIETHGIKLVSFQTAFK